MSLRRDRYGPVSFEVSRLSDDPLSSSAMVVIVVDVPETEQHRSRGRGRLVVLGRRTDNDKRCTLLVVNEADGSWSFHALGASAGVKLGKTDTLALIELILARTEVARPTMSPRSDRLGGTR
jgi:hypothetical protein